MSRINFVTYIYVHTHIYIYIIIKEKVMNLRVVGTQEELEVEMMQIQYDI